MTFAQTVRECPVHGLALFNLPIVVGAPTPVPWEYRAGRSAQMNAWYCSHCGRVVDELPLFARPCPGDGLTTDPAASGGELPSHRRVDDARTEAREERVYAMTKH